MVVPPQASKPVDSPLSTFKLPLPPPVVFLRLLLLNTGTAISCCSISGIWGLSGIYSKVKSIVCTLPLKLCVSLFIKNLPLSCSSCTSIVYPVIHCILPITLIELSSCNRLSRDFAIFTLSIVSPSLGGCIL